MTWDLDGGGDGGQRLLLLGWRESGAPMLGGGRPPARQGYGRELIEEALPYQLGAETRLGFGPDGVRCAIAVPVGRGGGGRAVTEWAAAGDSGACGPSWSRTST